MKHVVQLFVKMDWPLLRDQKQTLLDLNLLPTKQDRVDGIINLIDALQDAAVDAGFASEHEVFSK